MTTMGDWRGGVECRHAIPRIERGQNRSTGLRLGRAKAQNQFAGVATGPRQPPAFNRGDEMPCYLEHDGDGGTVFLCGCLGPHCAACASVSGFLCDYPVSEGKTCDLPLCDSHAYEVAPNLHYCPGHLILWKEFRDSGGVRAALENVAPYKELRATLKEE